MSGQKDKQQIDKRVRFSDMFLDLVLHEVRESLSSVIGVGTSCYTRSENLSLLYYRRMKFCSAVVIYAVLSRDNLCREFTHFRV